MNFSDFYGQNSAVGELRSALGRGRVAHGFLLIGPEGSGKKTLARLCAKTVLCKAPDGQEKPCGTCPACRRFESGSHPDYIELEPKDTIQIGIEPARDLIELLAEQPFDGGARAVLIAKRITPEAQNALLKTLEEPPMGTVFFVTAAGQSQLLPTVLSRLQILRLTPLPIDICACALEKQHGVPPERAKLLARISGGIIGQALTMHSDQAFWKAREDTYALLALDSESEAPRLAASIASADGKAFLSCLQTALCDVLRCQNGSPRSQSDMLESTEAFAKRVPAKVAALLLDNTMEYLEKLNGNVSWQALSRALVFGWMEVTKGWQR